MFRLDDPYDNNPFLAELQRKQRTVGCPHAFNNRPVISANITTLPSARGSTFKRVLFIKQATVIHKSTGVVRRLSKLFYDCMHHEHYTAEVRGAIGEEGEKSVIRIDLLIHNRV